MLGGFNRSEDDSKANSDGEQIGKGRYGKFGWESGVAKGSCESVLHYRGGQLVQETEIYQTVLMRHENILGEYKSVLAMFRVS